MKVLVISFRTTGLLKDMYEEYCLHWSSMCELYCLTNDNVRQEDLNAEKCLNLHYRRNEPTSYLSPKKICQAKKFIDDINPDVVFFFSPHPNNIPLIRFASKYCLVAQVHNPIPHSGTKISERIISEIQKRLYAKYCDHIYVAGEKLKEDLNAKYNIANDRITSRKFAALSNLVSNKTIDNKDIYDVIFFGRIEAYKGIDVLIDSLKYINRRIHVLIVGKGKPYFQVSQDYSDITFINEFVSDKDLAKMISNSKIVVMPYKDATGTSTVIQAFSYGKPVIATNVGVFPEYVGSGGVIVEPNNAKELGYAIGKVLDDESLRNELGLNGYKAYKEDFSITKFCKFYINSFEELLRKS